MIPESPFIPASAAISMVVSGREVHTMSVTAQPISPPGAADDGAVPTEPIYRLSVAQYYTMADHGILDEDDPVELLEGWLVQKMTKHRPHSRCTGRTRRALERIQIGRASCREQE